VVQRFKFATIRLYYIAGILRIEYLSNLQQVELKY